MIEGLKPYDVTTPKPGEPVTLPFANCYCLPNCRLLAGEYPGAPDPAETREKLRRLLAAGVTYFIDLTEEGELEPYEEILAEEAAAARRDVTYVRLPIGDMRTPAAAHMRAILDTIGAALDAGHTVFVHCWGGVGRTGTVIGCHLVRCGHSGDAALAEVARLFATMSPGKLRRHPEGSPETETQREFVRSWADADKAHDPAPARRRS